VTKTFNDGFAEYGIWLTHHFSSGVYAKQVDIPAGRILQQHAHTFDHLSILASGKVIVRADGWVESYCGPAAITIRAGVVHEVESLTDAVWFCIHATDETDIGKVDAVLTQ
jgi:quercetin dioxygenase-like cupin family protein